MSGKRTWSGRQSGCGQVDELDELSDDFEADARREHQDYQREVEGEQAAREKAQKANRRYVKARSKGARASQKEEQANFDKLRDRLGLQAYEAKIIQQASLETLRSRKQRYEDELEEQGGPAERDAPTQSKWAGPLTRPSRTSAAHRKGVESDSEEDLIPLSMPRKHCPVAVPVHLASGQRAPAQLRQDEGTASSSDEELISLSMPAGRQSRLPPPSGLVGTLQASTTGTPLRDDSDTALPDISAALVAPAPTSRPDFPLSLVQSSVGPLQLGEEVKVPATINRFLRDYQRDGVRFMYKNYKQGRGGILGDDMGLGKTIQVIAFLSAIMDKQGLASSDAQRRINAVRAGRLSAHGQRADELWPTCLIICPASVMTNWQNELDTWGYFEHATMDADSLKDFARGRLDILITSHQTGKLWIDSINQQHWSVVFVDECHTLKNPASNLTLALNSIPCTCRFGLTGTAIQNRLEEFWTLLNWSSPGFFGSLIHWQQLVAEPIRRGQAASASAADLARARRVAEQLKDRLLPDFFLRRTKDLIKAQLPNKRDNIVFCPLTNVQLEAYKSILLEPEVVMIRRAKEACDCGQEDDDGLPYQRCKCCYREDAEGNRWNYHMLKYIMLLQRCSNHLALVFPDPQDNIDVTSDAPLTEQMRKKRYLRQVETVKQLFPDSWQTKKNNKANGFQAEYCGKWLVLRRLMQEWKRQNDKVLLFSLNLRLLDWLAYFVELEGYRHLRLDGSTPQKKRQALVDDFNRDPAVFVFLISTTAGGTGLNLTGANKVVVFDPHWNPAHDLQAMDRAYRFGQTRDVDVYRLIGRGSLEETIYDRQVYKQQMGRIGYDASEERRYFEAGDAQGFPRLFELHETGNVTKDIIKACDVAEAAFALEHIVQDAEVDKMASDDAAASLPPLASAPPPAPVSDGISAMLHLSGIEYTHINDSLLGGSAVETAMSRRAKDTVAPRRRSARQPKAEVPSWPPQRSNKQE